jgi:(p)ppGpp synthase/HD superfamily hydrolase
MHSFAQTNIQLLNQLRDDGYSTAETFPVITSYETAMRLFTGLFRASGKTFIAHLVGTASILGRLRASSSVVAAGLLHAAYSSGDFADGKKGITESHRDWVRSRVGTEIEEYVSRYTALEWTKDTAPVIWREIDNLESIDRHVLLIRLANELEEFLDLGILYSGEERRRQSIDGYAVERLMVQMAEKLGYPALATEIANAFAETIRAEIPHALRGNGRDVSFLIAPQSYQRVMDALAKRFVPAEPPDETLRNS